MSEEKFVWTDEDKIHFADFVKCFSKYANINDVMDAFAKLKQSKQPLFTTQDGKPMYEGDECYALFDIQYHFKYSGNPPIERCRMHDNPMTRVKDTLYFSTEEKAKEYILYNKPVLSLNDIINSLPALSSEHRNDTLIRKLKQLVQGELPTQAKQ